MLRARTRILGKIRERIGRQVLIESNYGTQSGWKPELEDTKVQSVRSCKAITRGMLPSIVPETPERIIDKSSRAFSIPIS